VTRPSLTRRLVRRALVVSTAAAMSLAVPAAAASANDHDPRGSGAVFVQLNGETGNAIAAYPRGRDGLVGGPTVYPTGGLGGTEVDAPLDALASQASLVLDREHRMLLAVNAGSDTLTTFSVDGARLSEASVVPSGGEFPASIAVHHDLVYVLNAGGGGSISGFRITHGSLVPLAGSTRSLGLGNANPPLFISAPGQVGFSQDGRTLVVTTKNHNQLLTFPVDKQTGLPAASPMVTASAGAVPFSFVVDPRGTLHVTEAGTGKVSSYSVNRDGSLSLLGSSASNGAAALCWNVLAGRTVYGVNAGSSSISAWTVRGRGAAELVAPVAATTGAGSIDIAASRNERFLYVQEAVAGTVGVYEVSRDGSLQRIQTVTGLPAFTTTGMEGIAAS
jgi:6-phosphogluconolactonase (cycloisomerase 2 family)